MFDCFPSIQLTKHEKARRERLTADRGHYTRCRHYKSLGARKFECRKYGDRRTCQGCMTCPNCGGPLYTYRLHKSLRRNIMYFDHSKSCTLCGAFIEEGFAMYLDSQQKSGKGDNSCSVSGCTHTVYERYEYKTENKVFVLCQTHRNRLKSWRQHKSKGQQHHPLLLEKGVLVDNPNYKIKQRKSI